MTEHTQIKKVYKYDNHTFNMIKRVALSLYTLNSEKLNKRLKII